MKSIKTVIIVLILLLTGVLAVVGLRAAKTFLSGAASGCEPSGIRAQADVGSATISWQTEKECQGVVEYGTTPASLLLRALETQPVATHRVVLSPLKENTTYYFRIRVGEDIYDNNGIPHSFKTILSEGRGQEEILAPTSMPTRGVSGTGVTTPGSCAKVSQCKKLEFNEKFGTSECAYDFDANGVVNSADWIECLNTNK